MPAYNQWTALGNLCRDPELRYTPKGTAVCGVSMAVNHKWTDSQGNKKEDVFFMDLSAWQHTAEFIGQYCKKGTLVMVTGRLSTQKWTDKHTGQERQKVVCQVSTVQLCGNGREVEEAQADPAPAKPRATGPATGPATQNKPADPDQDDVPF